LKRTLFRAGKKRLKYHNGQPYRLQRELRGGEQDLHP
jgi:hypothetical protein